jgi:hypothetical protein
VRPIVSKVHLVYWYLPIFFSPLKVRIASLLVKTRIVVMLLLIGDHAKGGTSVLALSGHLYRDIKHGTLKQDILEVLDIFLGITFF